jgi:Uma2 family endonuclease
VHNYRCPDVVVVLKEGRAIDCGTHWMGGPDFLVEVESPEDQINRKIPFYSKLQVRELMIVHGTTRHLQLYRHDGQQLVAVEPSDFKGAKWLISQVLPLVFRRRLVRKKPLTEIQRTDGVPGNWTV